MKIESNKIKDLGYKPDLESIRDCAKYIQTQMASIKVATDRIIHSKTLFDINKELGYLKEHTDKLVATCNMIFEEHKILDLEKTFEK